MELQELYSQDFDTMLTDGLAKIESRALRAQGSMYIQAFETSSSWAKGASAFRCDSSTRFAQQQSRIAMFMMGL